MGVRQLAGPFNVTYYDGQPADAVFSASIVMWWPGIGLVSTGELGGFFAAPTGVMTMDGRYCDRSTNVFYSVGWWPAKNAMVSRMNAMAPGRGYELVYDPLLFSPELSGPQAYNDTHPLMGKQYIKLPDRSIYYEGFWPTDPCFQVVVGDVEVGREGPLPLFTSGYISPGRHNAEVFLVENTRSLPCRAIFYDTVTKNWSSPLYYIPAGCYGVTFASEFGVIISHHNYITDAALDAPRKSDQLRIWSLEVNPTIVTDVEVDDGEVKSGQVVTYRVRVTGDQNDPAEGELVNWSLSVGSAGSLQDLQTKTDVDGYARVKVVYDVGETGVTVIEASVTC